MNKKLLAVLIVSLVACGFLTGCQSERMVKTPDPGTPRNKAVYQDHSVNLDHGMLTVAGVGLPPKDSAGDAQAKLLARRAAIVEGQRNLALKLAALERRVGLPATDPVTIKNYTIVEEKQLADGGYRVVLRMKLNDALLKRLR